jgi:predicted TPR repeat methyltransferase
MRLSDVVSPMPVSSGDVVIDRRFEWARESLAAGDAIGAADLLEQTLELAPRYAPAWFALGQAREALGDKAGAIAAFREARACDAEDRLGAGLHLVRLGAAPGTAVPAAYVQTLYDAYAPRFEQSLVDRLGYRAPDLLLRAVQAQRPAARFPSMLDLGCGTGLGGAAFHEVCDRITGVDLSPAMLAKAQAKGVYARLVAADLGSFLADEATAGASYDLIVAADVLIYIEALAPLLTAMARVLKPGGLVAFDVETHDGEGSLLRDTLRYAHAADIVRAAAAGLTLLSLDSAVSRHEKGAPVPGLVVVAET